MSWRENDWDRSPSEVPTNQLGMKILYRGSRIDVDIVAVHGLGAIPDITWRDKRSQVNWLQDTDMLPYTIPNSRIMRFGYDSLWFCRDPVRTRAETISNTFLANLQEYREDCPDRPVIFIGHCFGGLVIQKALTLDSLKNSPKQTPTILSNTAGIIFLGTPHSGTATSIHDRITNSDTISLILATSDLRQEGEILRNLESSHSTLSQISKDFLTLCSEYNAVVVVNFFEQRSSHVENQFGGDGLEVGFIVGEASATLGHYPSYGLPLDHYSLNKFASQDDGNFQLVLGQIKRIYALMTKTVRISQTSKQPSDSAPSLNPGWDTLQPVERPEGSHTPSQPNASSNGEVEENSVTTTGTVESDERLPKLVKLSPLAYNPDLTDKEVGTPITFINSTSTDINVYHVVDRNLRRLYRTLKPDEAYRIGGIVRTRPWEVVDGGRTIQFLPTPAAENIAFIGATDYPLYPLAPIFRNLSGLKSIESNTPTFITFINLTIRSVIVYWINYQGERQRFNKLDPGKGCRIRTFVTHLWEVDRGGCTIQFLPTLTAEYVAFIGSTSLLCLFPLAYNRDMSGLRSIDSKNPTFITFDNFTPTDVNVDWISYQGERQRFKTLKPNEAYTIRTFNTHAWEVVVEGHTTQYLPAVHPANDTTVEYAILIGVRRGRSLQALSMDECMHHRSMTPSGAATAINFYNDSNDSVVIYWIDLEGNRQFCTILEPRLDVHKITYTNHIWEVITAQNTAHYMPSYFVGNVDIG